MGLLEDLLEQAGHLARRERKRPRQASRQPHRAGCAAGPVATAFADLQEARHQADYDLSEVLTRVDVLQKLALARQAFADWQAIKGTPNAAVFLAALLLQRHWSQG